jgi:hypothetical protein
LKARTQAAQNTVTREGAIRIATRVYAEWEYNRFTVPTVTVTPSQAGNDEWAVTYGDVSTIALPNRPRTGIAKARSENSVKPLGEFRDTPQAARFYPSSPNDLYKYWSSVQRSRLAQTAGGYNFDEPIKITVMYPEDVVTNKLVVGFETSYAKPTSFSIQYTVNGTDWVLASTNPALGANGITELYHSSLGWDVEQNLENPIIIKGVRLNVYSMNGPYKHLDVLQLGARLHNDLTDVTESYQISQEVSDRSFIAPMGQASSNTATITLSNIDGRFNNQNEESLYYGMIDKKVRFTIDFGINTQSQGGVGIEWTREFTGWSDSWGSALQSSIDVDLKDSSVYLQEQDMPTMFLEGMTAGAIVWAIMDKMGMANYAYARATNDFGQIIPFFWPGEEQTVWECIAELAQATQTAVFFDEYDVMQIRARRAMYADKQVDWNFDAVQNGQKQPDIISMEFNNDLEVNKVDVNYKPAAYSDFNKGLPKMETVWEPEDDTVLLRSSGLVRDLTREGNEMWIKQADAIKWPFTSLVNIRGEIMRYKGKEYGYHEGTVYKTKIVYTQDEVNALDQMSETLYWKNSYTGKFIVTERQLFGSGWSNHLVEPDFTDMITTMDNIVFYPYNGGARNVVNGVLGVGNIGANPLQYHYVKAGSKISAPVTNDRPKYYGARIRFPSVGLPNAVAGIVFEGDYGDTGYYIELATTENVDNTGRQQHELCCRVMPANAGMYWATAEGGDNRGYKAGILRDVWYDLDAKIERLNNDDVRITAYLNGVLQGAWQVKSAQQPAGNAGTFGMHVRAITYAEFEYVYGFSTYANEIVPQDPDKSSVLDLLKGGYSSGFIEKEVKYNFRLINPAHITAGGAMYYPQIINDANFAIYEFGPVVHELREFDVQFKEESRPVGHSNILVSNEEVEIIAYESDAFGARFLLANASRKDEVVKGEDQIDGDTTVSHVILIYGRSVYQEEEKTITKSDLPSIRKTGVTKTQVESRYIQTDEMAAELGQWIVDLWASGVDEIELTIFANPFLQLGDLVTMNFPVKGMLPSTHKYFVTAISKEMQEGYTMKVTLRRAKV